MLLHRFSTKTFFKYSERLKDDVKLRAYVTQKRQHSTDDDLDDFISVLHSKMHDIDQVLRPLKENARKNSGAEIIGKGLAVMNVFGAEVADGSLFTRGYVSRIPQFNAFDRAVTKVTAAPLAKIFTLSNYDMSLHEVTSTTSRSGYAIELRLYSPQGAQVLVSSDWPVTVKGIKLRTKQPAGASV